MTSLKIPASYYQQFDADHTLVHPAETYGGWQQAEVVIAPQHTALVVMHAWNNFTPEKYPGSFRAEDHLLRANAICETVMPPLLKATRAANLPVLHVVGGGDYYKHMLGYLHGVALAEKPLPLEPAESDPVLEALQQFRQDNVFPGKHNAADCHESFRNTDFHPGAKPLENEGIAHFDYQLHALCKEAGINHLIYTGFALDGCLLIMPGGMVDMSRRGYMCSVLREATAACETRETALEEGALELALWRVSVWFGFVFGVDDFIRALANA